MSVRSWQARGPIYQETIPGVLEVTFLVDHDSTNPQEGEKRDINRDIETETLLSTIDSVFDLVRRESKCS